MRVVCYQYGYDDYDQKVCFEECATDEQYFGVLARVLENEFVRSVRVYQVAGVVEISRRELRQRLVVASSLVDGFVPVGGSSVVCEALKTQALLGIRKLAVQRLNGLKPGGLTISEERDTIQTSKAKRLRKN